VTDEVDQVQTLLGRYRQLRDERLFPASRRGDTAVAGRISTTELDPIAAELAQVLSAIFEQLRATAEATAEQAHADYRGRQRTGIVLLVAGLGLSVALAIGLVRRISNPGRTPTPGCETSPSAEPPR
jgi:outer membrane murein-binding lipoprotein Lpp